ncbi:hypothetical protein BH11PLA2_BH11PLA2_40370 [soil metagenome]
MLANIMPPVTVLVQACDIVTASTSTRGKLVVHPRYRHWLRRCGLDTAEHILALRGEIVSGHQDRHVARVGLGSRVVFLKREHRVGWKVRLRNWRAGFGFVSRCEREAKLLTELDNKALPGPQWIAYGHDGQGRAFLLVDDLAGCRELRDGLRKDDRADLPRRLAEAVGNVHAAGFDTPDLCAKHLFIRPDTGTITILDWPSTRRYEIVDLEARVLAWGQLDASLALQLASPRERLRTLHHYWRRFRHGLPRFSDFVAMVMQASRKASRRSSIREQRTDPAMNAKQRLIWLAEDEAVCVTPTLAKCWPTPAITSPFYPRPEESVLNGVPLVINAPDNQPATLRRWRSVAPLGRMLAAVRCQSWRSPATKRARHLFHRERHGQPAPQLLAFGQRFTGPFTTESFVLERS